MNYHNLYMIHKSIRPYLNGMWKKVLGNYNFLTLLHPAEGGAAEPHLTGCKFY